MEDSPFGVVNSTLTANDRFVVPMPQSLSQIYLHIVFSTKRRHPFLEDVGIRGSLHAYIARVCQSLKSPSLQIGGVADHVHALVNLARTSCPADLVRELKRSSSKWLKSQGGILQKFDWQDGYGAFSLSPIHVEPLRKYIINQERHHRKETFQEEYRRLMAKYQVQWDERYVWD